MERAWARDFAIIGAYTSLVAPGVVSNGRLPESYFALAVLTGGVMGYVLGWTLAGLLRGRGGLPLWMLPVVGLVLGGVWGGGTGAVAAVGLEGHMFRLLPLSVVAAAIAGAVQLGWLLLPYAWFRARKLPTWPLVLVASLLAHGLGILALSVLD